MNTSRFNDAPFKLITYCTLAIVLTFKTCMANPQATGAHDDETRAQVISQEDDRQAKINSTFRRW